MYNTCMAYTPPSDIAPRVNQYVGQIRLALGWTQADLGRIIGRNVSQVSRRLSGDTEWTLYELGLLCEAADAPITVLFDPDAFATFISRIPPTPPVSLDRRRGRDLRNRRTGCIADVFEIGNTHYPLAA